MHTTCKLCFSCFAWYFCLPEGIERIQRSAVKEIRQEERAVALQRGIFLSTTGRCRAVGSNFSVPILEKKIFW